jgi:hypothetical protein
LATVDQLALIRLRKDQLFAAIEAERMLLTRFMVRPNSVSDKDTVVALTHLYEALGHTSQILGHVVKYLEELERKSFLDIPNSLNRKP